MLHHLLRSNLSFPNSLYQTRALKSLATTLGIGSHGFLRIVQDAGAIPVNIEIVTGWEDNSSISGLKPELGMHLNVKNEDKILELLLKPHETNINSILISQPQVVKLLIPENFGVDISLCNGDVQISGTKLNADCCKIVTLNGSILANKVRCDDVVLDAKRGVVSVSSVAEATTMRLYGRAVNVKRIGASSEVAVTVDRSEDVKTEELTVLTQDLLSKQGAPILVVNSMYAPSAFVKCIGSGSNTTDHQGFSKPVKDPSTKPPPMALIDSMHGSIDIYVSGYPNDQPSSSSSSVYGCALAVERITGSVQAFVENEGNIEAHFDVVEGDSFLRTSSGNITLMVNQESMARINMRADQVMTPIEQAMTTTATTPTTKKKFIEIVEQDSRFVAVEDVAQNDVTTTPSSNSPSSSHFMNGFVRPLGKRHELVGGPGRGKIDLEAALRFNSSTSFFGTTSSGLKNDGVDEHDQQVINPQQGGDMANDELNALPPLPTISVHTSGGGRVKFESLSWKNSIKRKFGLY
jgi:hypothetical protein